MPDVLTLPPKAISLWQPWATLIVIGAKKIETRSWPMYHRGPIAIHAAKRTSELGICLEEPFASVLLAAGYESTSDLPLGAIVGACDIVDINHVEFWNGSLSEQERAFGNYSAGRWGWILEDAVRLDEPIPCKGMQGIWKWEPLTAEPKPKPEPVVDPQGVLL